MPEEDNERKDQSPRPGGERKEILPATFDDLRKIEERAQELGGQTTVHHEIDFEEVGILIEESKTEGDPGDIEDYSHSLPVGIIVVDTDEGKIEFGVDRQNVLTLQKIEKVEDGYPDEDLLVELSEGQVQRVAEGLLAIKAGDLNEGRRLFLAAAEKVYFAMDESSQSSDTVRKVKDLIEQLTKDGEMRVDTFISKDLSSTDEEIGRGNITVTQTDISPPLETPYVKTEIVFTKFNEDDSVRHEVEYFRRSDGSARCYERLYTISDFDAHVRERQISMADEDLVGLSEPSHEQAEFIQKLLVEAKKS